ncbi:hypothetical protein [Kutzneria sp. NPDC052558]|uniref:hypothetical protein n=1 Tax=Kutzneria sp. NPDC052558 TaxID=3364121 RepID=UPI0037C9ED91
MTIPWHAIGLSDEDGAVYGRLLSDPGVTEEGLAASTGLSPSQLRMSLQRLVDARLLRRASTAPTGWLPLHPKAAIGSLVRDRFADLDRVSAGAEQLAAEYTRGQLHAHPSSLLDVITSRADAAARIDELMATAGVEVVGTDVPPYVTDPDVVNHVEVALLARGVRFRALYAAEVLDNPGWLAQIAQMTELGEQARVLPQVPVKLCVVDARTAAVPLTATGRTVIVSESALTHALQALFELMWSHATPLRLTPGARPAVTAADMDPGYGDLVNLLSAGMKDDSIARHLNVSARTLRRRIAQLQDDLDAGGRFQAGVHAARRGWI